MQSTQLLTPELSYFDRRDCYMHKGLNAVCADFVRIILGMPFHGKVPQKIQLVVATEEIPDAFQIKIWKAYADHIFCWHWSAAAEEGDRLVTLSNGDPTLHAQVDEWFNQQGVEEGQTLWVKVAD
jgi:hypothetical protein